MVDTVRYRVIATNSIHRHPSTRSVRVLRTWVKFLLHRTSDIYESPGQTPLSANVSAVGGSDQNWLCKGHCIRPGPLACYAMLCWGEHTVTGGDDGLK